MTAYQGAANNPTFVPPPVSGGNPYYQARFDGVQGYTHHADGDTLAPAPPGGGMGQQPDQTLWGRPPRGAAFVMESLDRTSRNARRCCCTGTSEQLCRRCSFAYDCEPQIHYHFDQHQQGGQPHNFRARRKRTAVQRVAFAVGESGSGNHRRGPGPYNEVQPAGQNAHVYRPVGDIAMVPQVPPAGRKRRHRGSVEEYVGQSSLLADELDDPAFSYNGGPNAGTAGIRYDVQDPSLLQHQSVMGPNDLVCSVQLVDTLQSQSLKVGDCQAHAVQRACYRLHMFTPHYRHRYCSKRMDANAFHSEKI
jgi:hypothetical protein